MKVRLTFASFIEGWLAGRLCESYLTTKPNGRCACAPHFLTDQRMKRMAQKVNCDISRYRFKICSKVHHATHVTVISLKSVKCT